MHESMNTTQEKKSFAHLIKNDTVKANFVYFTKQQ